VVARIKGTGHVVQEERSMAASGSNASSSQSPTRNGNGPKAKIPLTAQGFEALKQELEHLITVERPQVADFIHEAKEAGDITDSSAYDEAKHRQSLLEWRIRELQYTLDNATIMDAPTHKGGHRTVRLGSTVEVETDRGAHRTFMLVSTVEADSTANKVSDQSPVGRALLDRTEGDKVEVATPGGTITYTVLSIH
jgi:transcription elongation factor GreA